MNASHAEPLYVLFESFHDFRNHLLSSENQGGMGRIYITRKSILDTDDISAVQTISAELKLKFVQHWLQFDGDYDHYASPVDLKSFDSGQLIYKSVSAIFSEVEKAKLDLRNDEILTLTKQLMFFLKNPHPMCHLYGQFGFCETKEIHQFGCYVLTFIDIADLYAEKMYFLNKVDIETAFSDRRLEQIKKKDFGDAKARWLAKKRFSDRWGVNFNC